METRIAALEAQIAAMGSFYEGILTTLIASNESRDELISRLRQMVVQGERSLSLPASYSATLARRLLDKLDAHATALEQDA